VTVAKWLWDFTAQSAHAGVAAAIMMGVREHAPTRVAIAILIIGAAAAAVKEFWYDYHYETVDERGSSPMDFTFYVLGLAVGFIVGGPL
jgi:Negative regulator of sigma F